VDCAAGQLFEYVKMARATLEFVFVLVFRSHAALPAIDKDIDWLERIGYPT
jgi:hypothetical protein